MKKTFILFIFFMLFTSLSFATPYYIDYSAGNDSNAGTSTGAAWKHFPNDPNATGVSAAHTPTGGNTYNFKRGITYYITAQITITEDGSSGNEIALTSDSGWGTGSYATFDNQLNPLATFYVSGASYVNISYLEGINVKGTDWVSNPGQFIKVRNSNNINVSYCYAHNLVQQDYTYGFYVGAASYNITLEYNISSYMRHGIYTVSSVTDGLITVQFNWTHHNINDGIRGDNDDVSNRIWYGNLSEYNDQDGYDIYGSLKGTFWYNVARFNTAAGFKVGGGNQDASSVILIYNLAYYNGQGFRSNTSVGQTFYGNVACFNSTNGFELFSPANTIVATWKLRNNIAFGNLGNEISISKNANTTLDLDYNLFYTISGSAAYYNGTSYSNAQIANYRTDTGQGAHSDFANPKFTAPYSYNFTLQQDSPAIGNGVNLGDTYDDALDPNNSSLLAHILTISTLDQDSFGSWDIGLYVGPYPSIYGGYPSSLQTCVTDPETVTFGLISTTNSTCRFSVKGTDTCATAFANLDEEFENTGATTNHSDTDESFNCNSTQTIIAICQDDSTGLFSNCLEIEIGIAAAGGETPIPSPGIATGGGNTKMIGNGNILWR